MVLVNLTWQYGRVRCCRRDVREASGGTILNLQREVVRVEGIRYELIELSCRATNKLSGSSQILLLLLGSLTFTSPVWSLGLGNLEVNSNLDEPLDVRIELVASRQGELETAEAALASSEEFNLIGLQRPEYLNDVEFTIVTAAEGDGANSFAGP